jgi:hypothetical protein
LVQLEVRTDVPFAETVVGLAVSVQTGAAVGTTLPFSTTVFGLLAALLVIVIELTVETAVLGL